MNITIGSLCIRFDKKSRKLLIWNSSKKTILLYIKCTFFLYLLHLRELGELQTRRPFWFEITTFNPDLSRWYFSVRCWPALSKRTMYITIFSTFFPFHNKEEYGMKRNARCYFMLHVCSYDRLRAKVLNQSRPFQTIEQDDVRGDVSETQKICTKKTFWSKLNWKPKARE